jgi:ABC-type bacteriocin/lantibiotic exporter with double-glycine peptidase domain
MYKMDFINKIEEVLKNNNEIIIYGNAGSGKRILQKELQKRNVKSKVEQRGQILTGNLYISSLDWK